MPICLDGFGIGTGRDGNTLKFGIVGCKKQLNGIIFSLVVENEGGKHAIIDCCDLDPRICPTAKVVGQGWTGDGFTSHVKCQKRHQK